MPIGPALAILLAAQPMLADLIRHQGTWAVVRFEREGATTPADLLASITRTVEGDHVVWRREGKNFAGTSLILNPAAKPTAIDLVPDGGPERGRAILGIYRFDADGTLILCVADAGLPRPSEFNSPPGGRRTVQVFRRIEPEAKECRP